ncbi:permease [Alsobacter sp. R-9]
MPPTDDKPAPAPDASAPPAAVHDATPLPQRPPKRGLDWSFWVVAGLSIVSAVAVWRRDGPAVFFDVLEEDLILFLEIVPKVVAGTLIGALIRLMIGREMIVRWLGASSGIRGLLIATIAGVLIPAGPFTVFPLAATFLVAGADAGAAIAFITGWLLLGLNRAVIWEMPFFGAAFVGWRMASSFWVPMAAGWLARYAMRLKWFKEGEGMGPPGTTGSGDGRP